MHSLTYAVRALLQERGFTAAAVLMLAIGIGANTAMFSIVRAVLLRPMGFHDPDGIVMVWPSNVQRSHAVGELSFGDYRDLQRRASSFARVAIIGSVNWWGTFRVGDGEPFGASMSAVSATFFDTLGARPLLGRTFRLEEDDPTSPPVLVLSHSLWLRRFSGDPKVVGSTVRIKQAGNEESVEIIGVMPPEFFFPRGAEYWAPAAAELGSIARKSGDPPGELLRGLNVYHAIGRLKSGVTVAQARADTNTLMRALFAEAKMDSAGTEMVLTPIVDHIFGAARRALQVLMGAVAAVLLIVCTNIASLLLARGAGRRREIAVRAALGASRWQLFVHLLAQAALLAIVGAVFGVSVAALSLDLLVAFSPADIPRLDATSLDAGVLVFSGTAAVLTALLVGVFPAWQLTRPSLADDLKGSGSGGTSRSTHARTRQALVTVQVAATVVLLIAAGLCVQSLQRLNRLDLGFDPTNVLTFRINRLEDRHPGLAARTEAVEQLLSRFERIPHVIAAGGVLNRPFEHRSIGMDSGFILEGQPLTPEAFMRNPMLNWESVTPGYFRAMGIRLLRGRNFDERDTATAPLVVIVSETLASRVWPGQDPIGKRLNTLGAQEDGKPLQWQTVVGVVETARYREIESPRLDLYVPLRQAPSFVNHYTVRTSIDPLAVAPTLRAEISSFDPALSISSVQTMEEIVARTKGPWRFNTLVFSLFGLLALGLAAVGLFALVAYSVAQRTREIGVRVALGATPANVVGLMLSQGATFAAIGLAGGLLVAMLATRLMSSLLFEVSATDPASFIAAAAGLLAVCTLASYVPARRAAGVDPLVALRDE
jgi:putative ABC transport system permease protein